MNETALRGSAANSPTGNAQVSQPASEAGLISECEPNSVTWGPAALEQRRRRTRDHLTKIAARREDWINRNGYYYELLNRLLRFLVEPQKKVLSVRCDTGNLLAAVRPSKAKGVDISAEIVEIAQQGNPSFEFAVAFPDKEEFKQAFAPDEKSDYILFNDIGDIVDVLQALRNLGPICQRHTRLLVTTYNHLWEPLVTLAEWLGMKVPRTEQNWLSSADIRDLLKLAGFEALETHRIVLLPKYLPLLSGFLNRFCARLPFLSKLCMTQVVVARMLPRPVLPKELSVSVVVPCKNEKGNVEEAVRRIAPLAGRTEITLCGTKVLWRSYWERIKPMLGAWGTEDRWGDYELLLGAAKLNLKILALPVHYQERIYGSTKMTKVFRNGLVMLKMCWHGFLKLKLGY